MMRTRVHLAGRASITHITNKTPVSCICVEATQEAIPRLKRWVGVILRNTIVAPPRGIPTACAGSK